MSSEHNNAHRIYALQQKVDEILEIVTEMNDRVQEIKITFKAMNCVLSVCANQQSELKEYKYKYENI